MEEEEGIMAFSSAVISRSVQHPSPGIVSDIRYSLRPVTRGHSVVQPLAVARRSQDDLMWVFNDALNLMVCNDAGGGAVGLALENRSKNNDTNQGSSTASPGKEFPAGSVPGISAFSLSHGCAPSGVLPSDVPQNSTSRFDVLRPGLVKRQLFKTKRCPHFQNLRCQRGSDCTFAHAQEELRPLPDLRNTRLCDTVRRGGHCGNPVCIFAHDRTNLRTTDSRLYKVRLCNFNRRGKCLNGSHCRFAHGTAELRGPMLLKQRSNVTAYSSAPLSEPAPGNRAETSSLTSTCRATSRIAPRDERPSRLLSHEEELQTSSSSTTPASLQTIYNRLNCLSNFVHVYSHPPQPSHDYAIFPAASAGPSAWLSGRKTTPIQSLPVSMSATCLERHTLKSMLATSSSYPLDPGLLPMRWSHSREYTNAPADLHTSLQYTGAAATSVLNRNYTGGTAALEKHTEFNLFSPLTSAARSMNPENFIRIDSKLPASQVDEQSALAAFDMGSYSDYLSTRRLSNDSHFRAKQDATCRAESSGPTFSDSPHGNSGSALARCNDSIRRRSIRADCPRDWADREGSPSDIDCSVRTPSASTTCPTPSSPLTPNPPPWLPSLSSGRLTVSTPENSPVKFMTCEHECHGMEIRPGRGGERQSNWEGFDYLFPNLVRCWSKTRDVQNSSHVPLNSVSVNCTGPCCRRKRMNCPRPIGRRHSSPVPPKPPRHPLQSLVPNPPSAHALKCVSDEIWSSPSSLLEESPYCLLLESFASLSTFDTLASLEDPESSSIEVLSPPVKAIGTG